jgi:hypothetical protein
MTNIYRSITISQLPNRDLSVVIDRAWFRNITALLSYTMSLLDFIVLMKMLFI